VCRPSPWGRHDFAPPAPPLAIPPTFFRARFWLFPLLRTPHLYPFRSQAPFASFLVPASYVEASHPRTLIRSFPFLQPSIFPLSLELHPMAQSTGLFGSYFGFFDGRPSSGTCVLLPLSFSLSFALSLQRAADVERLPNSLCPFHNFHRVPPTAASWIMVDNSNFFFYRKSVPPVTAPLPLESFN